VDLGLVYKCEISPMPTGGNRIDIDMTMTAPGCGMGEYLKSDVEEKLGNVPGVKAVNVEIVWEPVWDRDRMSEAAKLQLGMY
jgi:metal-sulfur cluster biosynthetic enzyme